MLENMIKHVLHKLAAQSAVIKEKGGQHFYNITCNTIHKN